MEIKENIPLAPFTTLHIGGPARYFVEVANEQELAETLTFTREKNLPVFVLSGGSNILVSDRGFSGLVIRPIIKGREILEDSSDYVRIRVGAGEVLDELIAWTVENNWWGLENLSFIPGLTGALAIQNVGAYGQEASEVIEGVEVMDRFGHELKIMSNSECGFMYRHSRFNTNDKNKYIILRINLRLKKNGKPNLSYKDVANYFGGRTPKQGELRDAIIEIRKKKGQDPNQVWSAGSFFSNFRLTDQQFESLCKKIREDFGVEKESELLELVKKVAAPSDGDKTKVPAAWILDQLLGLKGKQVGKAKLSDKQVLNMINVGGATAADCIELFHQVRDIVREKTGLELVNEPEFVGF
ncbi:MAG TPA: UDP-N-acetylmuramate dehydrogenase [Candidatus Paceibacterota bacterium]